MLMPNMLKAARALLGIRQSELAKAAGISLEVGPYTVISSIDEFLAYLKQEIEEQTGIGLQTENDEELYRGWE